MNKSSRNVQRTYLTITLFSTLAASFIWGINTLFLIDAGLSNLEAFSANAFFTAGMVLFEVPTGVVADTWGRRASYLIGTVTLIVSTLLYLLMWQIAAPFWGWAISSVLIGLGFTFFSGAVEAWLVDCLKYTKFKGDLESVFAKGQIVAGIAMLTGSVAGGVIAQFTNLGVPYILRSVMLIIAFIAAFRLMKDLGFKPKKTDEPLKEMKAVLSASIQHGWKKPSVKWLMLAAPFASGAGVFAFYALQPYLLELYGDPTAYSVAGLAAAVIAGAQIIGGLIVPYFKKIFKLRTTALLSGTFISAVLIFYIGVTSNFWVAVVLMVMWAMIFATTMPIRQAYLNGEIPSEQRATVLSFDALMGSGGGVVSQPALGRAADVWSYSTAYAITAAITILAMPFTYLAKRTNAPSDSSNH